MKWIFFNLPNPSSRSYGPGVDSTSNRNEYQESSWGVKGGRLARKADNLGRAVAQAVGRWLPTAAARVRVRAACGVCGGQSGTAAGFLGVLRFPLPIIPPISLLS
jgi:hypothetical protein